MKRFPRTQVAIYLFYLLIAVLITWPLLTVLSTHFPGFVDGDAHEMTRHIWWFKYALQHGQSLIAQPLLGYPDAIQGVILWSDPLQFFPGWLFALFMPLPAAYNLFVLLTLAFNGYAAYWLVEQLLRYGNPDGAVSNVIHDSEQPTTAKTASSLPSSSPFSGLVFSLSRIALASGGEKPVYPALLAGLIFMTAPVIQGHLAGGHGGLLVQWPLPLLAYALLKLCDLPPFSFQLKQLPKNFKLFTLNFLLSVLLVFLTPLGHTLQLIYAVMPLVAVIGFTLLIRRQWQALIRLILAVGIGSAVLLIFLLPVFSATFGTSAYTGEAGGVRYSADLLAIVTPSFEHVLFGKLDFTHRVLGVNIVEGSAYIGIIAALLAIIALWKVKVSRWWLIVALVAWLLSLGPLLKVLDAPLQTTVDGHATYITLPWALLHNLPGFSLARTPGRFDFLLALAVAVLSGYGASFLFYAIHRRNFKLFTLNFSLFAFLLLTLLILFEYQSFWPLPTYSAEIPQAVYDLSKRDDVRAVFDLPWDNVLAAKDALWLQTAHEKPMIAGQVTRSTPVSPAKLAILQQSLDPALLKDAGVDVIIVHKKYDSVLAETVRQHLGTPFYEDDQIALFNVPDTNSPKLLTPAITTLDQITNSDDSYFYVPEPGWLRFLVILTGEGKVSFKLDRQLLNERTISGETKVVLDFPIITPGYHTVTMTHNPPCPSVYDAVYACKSLTLSVRGAGLMPNFNVFFPLHLFESISNSGTSLIPDPSDVFIDFDHSVRLNGARFDMLDELQPVTLWWQFDQPVTDQDIRFVKVLDEQGNQVAGDDHPLGDFAAGDQWLESLSLNLPADLAPGTYKVYVGWYTYPDLSRFPVLSDVSGAQDSLALIGEFSR